MCPLHQVMPVPAPMARLSYSTMGHGVIDGNRFGLHPFYEPSVMERKTRTIALARGGTCNPTSSIGTFLINSLSGFLGLWDLRLALQMESKVLFARSFGFDACSRIDFLPCMSLFYMDERLFGGEKKNTVVFLLKWESRNCCFTTSQIWCVMKLCLEENRSTNSSMWSAEPGEREIVMWLPVGKTFQAKSNISC